VGVSTRRGEVLPMEVIAFSLTNAVRERDVVGRVDRDRFRGGVRTTVGIRARDGIGSCHIDSNCIHGAAVAPRIRARACGRQCGVFVLTEAVVAGDAYGGQGVDCNRDVCCVGTTFGVRGSHSIYPALPNINAVARAAVAPNIADSSIGREGGSLILANGSVAKDGGRG